MEKTHYYIETEKIETKPGYSSHLKCKIYKKTSHLKDEEYFPSRKESEEFYSNTNGVYVGEYQRNYSCFYNTFWYFKDEDKYYALVSNDYNSTSILDLQTMEFIVDKQCEHFCPVDFYVPNYKTTLTEIKIYEGNIEEIKSGKKKNEMRGPNMAWKPNMTELEAAEKSLLDSQEEYKKYYNKRAFVMGCCWGDDSGGWKLLMIDISDFKNGNIKFTEDLGYTQLSTLSHQLRLHKLIDWDTPTRIQLPLETSYELNLDNPKESGYLGYDFEDLKMYEGKFYNKFKIVRLEGKEGESEIDNLFKGKKPKKENKFLTWIKSIVKLPLIKK